VSYIISPVTLPEAAKRFDEIVGEFPEEAILKYFRFDHINSPYALMSVGFSEAAHAVVTMTPRCAERTVALRKLLEGRDAAIRAVAEHLMQEVVTGHLP
jgi:hypothetical protein